MDYYKLLDECLDYIAKSEGNGIDVLIFEESLRTKYDIPEESIYATKEKLIKDGYIYEFWSNHYRLTFEGYVFIQDGKYGTLRERERLENAAELSRNERMERNEERLALWTKILGIGTVALVLVETLVHWKDLKEFFCLYC